MLAYPSGTDIRPGRQSYLEGVRSAPARQLRAGSRLPELRRVYTFISDVVVVFKVHAKCVVFLFSPMLCNIHFLTGNFFVQHFNKHFAFKLCL